MLPWLRRYRRWIVGAWLLALFAVGCLLVTGSDRAAVPQASDRGQRSDTTNAAADLWPAVSLPADDAGHGRLTEWWYYSGHLRSASGKRYSFHLASFLRQETLAHAVFHGSLLDHQSGILHTEQARTAGNPSLGQRDGFDLRFASWRLQGGGDRHSATMAGKEFKLELQMRDDQAPVLHQAPGTPIAGLLDFGVAGKSYYVSRPRMKAEGVLTLSGEQEAVSGEVWFDHQWGDFEAARLRWNWFALQLATGADLMIFELFDREGAPLLRTGSYLSDGKVQALGSSDFTTTPRDYWQSRESGVVYPVRWTISLPSLKLALNVDPVLRASEFDARTTTLNVYWEGAVSVGGSHAGVGFMELSGYPPTTKVLRPPTLAK